MASSSANPTGTDLGPLISEEQLNKILKRRAPAAAPGQSGASSGKKPLAKKPTGPTLKRDKYLREESTDGSITHPGKRYKVRDRDLEIVTREMDAITPFVVAREAENNASFDADVYPEWRRAPGWNACSSNSIEVNAKQARHIERKDVGLASLMHLNDDAMKRDGATLVTYQEMQAAINDSVNLSLLGQAENCNVHWKFLVKSNRETATLAYARNNAEELLRSVPADGGRYRLTPMQRIATALMLEPRAEETVEVAVKKIFERGALGVRLAKAPSQPLNFIINNLSVASGKTWETIYATMSAVATPLAWRATNETFMAKRKNGSQQAAGLTELPPYGSQLELCRVVIALVPSPMIDHWAKTSEQLAQTFGEHKWITWSGTAPIRRATKKQEGIKRTLPVAVEACKTSKCALFWVMEATTKSSAAATRTGPQFAIPYRIVDEGTGTKHIEPRNYDPESPYMKTVICNATLDQLQKRTVHQRQHPLRVALDGETLDLSRQRHAALMTMCSQPSWLRLAVANSLAPLMPQGVLKIAMKVRVASLAARLNKTDMIISSTDDLIKGLVMRGANCMDPAERTAIENKCRAILHRTDKSESIAGSLHNSIEQVKADRKTITEALTEARRGRIPGELPRPEERAFEQDLERQDRALATMERLFTQLHEAIAGDPPPECPVTFDPIPAEHVCLCPSCAVILDHRMLEKLGWKCPCCRQKWNDGVVSAKQVADVVAQVPQPEEPAKDDDAGADAPSADLAHDTAALVQSYRDASKDKCASSLDAVVRSIAIALRYKPKGIRILLCCSVYGTAHHTSDQARNEEENTAKTRDFILKALPQLTSALTIGRGPRALDSYKANDDTNRLLIIDTSRGSTTMAGLDLQNTDLLIFDRLGSFAEDSTGTPRLVQSIGRIMRAQERTREERRQDAKHYAKTGKSVHSAKMVVFICHERAAAPGTSSSNPFPIDELPSDEEEEDPSDSEFQHSDDDMDVDHMDREVQDEEESLSASANATPEPAPQRERTVPMVRIEGVGLVRMATLTG
jgi:hypothetical protein